MGKVCVAIIGSTANEMVDRATEAMRDSPFLEFRLDYLEKPLAALPKLKQFLADNSVVTAIAMPLTFSIANGIAFGFIAYAAIKLLAGRFGEARPGIVVLAILFVVKFAVL